MAATDDTSKVRTRLEQTIEEQRAQLLQVHGVLTCLYEVLLYADGDDAVECAQAAQVAANLVSECVEKLDAVRIRPMIDELIPNSALRLEEPRVLYLR
jgi:hypothetical protein